jgi:hypothetical protein
MKFCEFFLQKELSSQEKEGQETEAWLSIKTAALEIEEGKYRLAAYCNRANIEVEVRIVYQNLEKGKLQPQSKEKVYRTNARGLTAVLPLTYLKQGLWEIRCRGNLHSACQEQLWEETLELKVLAKKVNTENLDRERQQSTFETENKAREAKLQAYTEQAIENSVNELDEFLAQSVEPILQELEALSVPHFDRAIALEFPEPEIESTQTVRQSPLIITLDRDILIWSLGEPILISGTIETLNNEPASGDSCYFQGKICYQLRDPQTAESFLHFEQNLLENKLPFTFNHSLEIVADCKTHLILGEILLEAKLLTPKEKNNQVILASQNFTIAADLKQLLQVLPKQKIEKETKPSVLETKLDPVVFSQIQHDLDLEVTSSDSVLLYGESSNVDECFPIFDRQKPLFTLIDSLKQKFNFSTLLPINSKTEIKFDKAKSIDNESFLILETKLELWEKNIQEIIVSNNNLDLEERLKIEDLPENIAERESLEFLVEDGEELLPESINNLEREKLSIPPDPVLIIEEKDLTAGESVLVLVKLPPVRGSVCVKLWIKDYQNRCLVGDPKIVSDLQPNVAGELEAKIQMDLPVDSLQICFEAISIDLDRQTESHKASVTRIILPMEKNVFLT